MLERKPLALALLLLLPAAPAPLSSQDGAERNRPREQRDSPRERRDPTVMHVAGDPIPLSVYRNWLVRTRGEPLSRLYTEYWLIRREAERRGAAVSAETIAAAFQEEVDERIEKAFGGDRERWIAELAQAGRSAAGRRAERSIQLESPLLLKELAAIDRVVSDEKIAREWELRYGRGGRRFTVRLIFKRLSVTAIPGQTADERKAHQERQRAELLEETLAIRERILGGESFAQLARQLSDDPRSHRQGGVPAGGFNTATWTDEQLDTLAALRLGEISEPMFARGGFWLVEMRGLEETSLFEVEDELRRGLLERGPDQDEVTAERARIWEGIEVEVLPAMRLEPEPGTSSRPPAEPVLEIDDTPVPRASFARWLLHFHGEVVAERFAEWWALERRAAEADIAVTPEEVSARVDEDIQREVDLYYEGDHVKWQRDVVRSRRTLEAYKREREVRTQLELLVEGLIKLDREVTDREVRTAWVERYGSGGRSIDLRLIRVRAKPEKPAPDAPDEEVQRLIDEAMAAARETAQKVVRRVADGEDFAALARRFSDDPFSKERGGVPPEGFRIDSLPANVGQAANALSPGEISEPLEVAFDGYWIVEVTALRVVPLEDVADALREELLHSRPNEVRIAAWRNVAMRDVPYEVLPAMFE